MLRGHWGDAALLLSGSTLETIPQGVKAHAEGTSHKTEQEPHTCRSVRYGTLLAQDNAWFPQDSQARLGTEKWRRESLGGEHELQCKGPEEASILGCTSATEYQDECEDRMIVETARRKWLNTSRNQHKITRMAPVLPAQFGGIRILQTFCYPLRRVKLYPLHSSTCNLSDPRSCILYA